MLAETFPFALQVPLTFGQSSFPSPQRGLGKEKTLRRLPKSSVPRGSIHLELACFLSGAVKHHCLKVNLTVPS